ncbi:ATP-dependent RNA helicase [Quillaja saponaria]|uniref:ATP-dependent RNA helicase n=1 Tax=Quillaja saponaria TaxID=32244 RepID=A0AAD7LCQ6_QUISA|nr:ATP-dependent RNA helicase [Quillaja saponaria]
MEDNARKMEKRVLLGVQKKKPLKRGKKKLLKQVVDYLKSDTHMFAPLIPPPTSDLRPRKTIRSSAAGGELKEPIKKNKRFVEAAEEYLKSDYYMYAPLVVSSQSISSPSQEHSRHFRKTSMSVLTRRVLVKDNQPIDHLANKVPENPRLSQATASDQHTRGYKEIVKHRVYQNCCSTSVSGKIALNSKLRKLVD